MAEVAKILSPNKTVVLPDINAGCSLSKNRARLRTLKDLKKSS